MKKNRSFVFLLGSFLIFLAVSCNNNQESAEPEKYPAIIRMFGGNINLNQLLNYANQGKPTYITKDNTGNNIITNAKATLGRVLFYDKQLSVNNTIACANCHKQAFAFSDDAQVSTGVNGTTDRHSMRLVNARFGEEMKFFWDERAATLEAQTTQPIQNHAEMGFSGQNGNPGIQDLINKLKQLDYYKELFKFVYNDENITESRLQESLSQFIRSIQSFDSKYDVGRTQVNADNQNFPNFTNDENAGKNLFLAPPQFNANGVRTAGGAGCGGCHRAPEFDIVGNSLNNGIVRKLTGTGDELNITRTPTLRNIFRNNGNNLNGLLMHTGDLTIEQVINHYNQISISPTNTNLDPKLRPNGNLQNLALTQTEKDQILAFLKTLTGTAVYTDTRWSNPFLP
ncbi:MAG: cytochrome-c peroxidase [Bacteroidetes bacterium]|nr:MAG: cytochrome-c peroxidase [Bacteroidota bacterium]TAG88473.1 MAG: cytochrome-c peroxidase [Bacteroidota bacterium]